MDKADAQREERERYRKIDSVIGKAREDDADSPEHQVPLEPEAEQPDEPSKP